MSEIVRAQASTALHFNPCAIVAGVSNIMFSSGEYDPWGSAGILSSPAPSRSLTAINVTGGGA
jgi:hypothetical protein